MLSVAIVAELGMVLWRWRIDRMADDGTGHARRRVPDATDDGDDAVASALAAAAAGTSPRGRYGSQQRTATQFNSRRRRRLEADAGSGQGPQVFM